MVHPSTLSWRLLSNAHAVYSPYVHASSQCGMVLSFKLCLSQSNRGTSICLNYAKSHLIKQRMRARMEQFRASEERMNACKHSRFNVWT